MNSNDKVRYRIASNLRNPRGYFKWTLSWGGVRQATVFSIMAFLRFFSSHVDAQFQRYVPWSQLRKHIAVS